MPGGAIAKFLPSPLVEANKLGNAPGRKGLGEVVDVRRTMRKRIINKSRRTNNNNNNRATLHELFISSLVAVI
jgi:hypothetical protein